MVVLSLAGCRHESAVAPPESVLREAIVTSYDPQFAFPRRGTYTFFHMPGEMETYGLNVRAGMARIDKAFKYALEDKGFRPGNVLDGVDFLMDYHILFKQNVRLLAEHGKGNGSEWIKVAQIPDDFISGALMLEISDARSGQTVWSGIWNANIALDEVSDEHKQERVLYAVEQLLKTFPPD